MEVNLSIKGVPQAIAERLRRRAQRHHRSLQGELMAIVEQAALEPDEPLSSAGPARRAVPTARGHSGREVIVRQGSKSTAEVAAELRALFPEPVSGVPSAVDILRALRDSR